MSSTGLNVKYFFDSYAIIEIINQTPQYEKLREVQITTNVLCLGEVYYYFLKVHNKQTADFWIEKLKADILPITKEIAIEASQLKFENKEKNFSYPDCIGYVSAMNNQMLFLTGDREFKNMKNVEFVK